MATQIACALVQIRGAEALATRDRHPTKLLVNASYQLADALLEHESKHEALVKALIAYQGGSPYLLSCDKHDDDQCGQCDACKVNNLLNEIRETT